MAKFSLVAAAALLCGAAAVASAASVRKELNHLACSFANAEDPLEGGKAPLSSCVRCVDRQRGLAMNKKLSIDCVFNTQTKKCARATSKRNAGAGFIASAAACESELFLSHAPGTQCEAGDFYIIRHGKVFTDEPHDIASCVRQLHLNAQGVALAKALPDLILPPAAKTLSEEQHRMKFCHEGTAYIGSAYADTSHKKERYDRVKQTAEPLLEACRYEGFDIKEETLDGRGAPALANLRKGGKHVLFTTYSAMAGRGDGETGILREFGFDVPKSAEKARALTQSNIFHVHIDANCNVRRNTIALTAAQGGPGGNYPALPAFSTSEAKGNALHECKKHFKK